MEHILPDPPNPYEEALDHINLKFPRFSPLPERVRHRELGEQSSKYLRSLSRKRLLQDHRVVPGKANEVFKPLKYSIGYSPDVVRPNYWRSNDDCLTKQSMIELNHDGCVNTASWNPSGTLLATSGDDLCVKTWSYPKLKALHGTLGARTGTPDSSTETLHSRNIFDVKFLPGNEKEVVTCGLDGRVCHAKLGASKQQHMVLHEAQDMVTMCEFVPESWSAGHGSVFYAACNGGGLIRYDLREGLAQNIIEYQRVMCLSLCDQSMYGAPVMATALGNNRYQLYDVRQSKSCLMESTLGDDLSVNVTSIQFSKMRRELLINFENCDIYLHDITEWTRTRQLRFPVEVTGVFPHRENTETFLKNATFFGPCEEYVMSGSDRGFFAIWDRRTLRLIGLVPSDSMVTNGVVPHPYERTVVSYGIDSHAKVFQIGHDLENNGANLTSDMDIDSQKFAFLNERNAVADDDAGLLQLPLALRFGAKFHCGQRSSMLSWVNHTIEKFDSHPQVVLHRKVMEQSFTNLNMLNDIIVLDDANPSLYTVGGTVPSTMQLLKNTRPELVPLMNTFIKNLQLPFDCNKTPRSGPEAEKHCKDQIALATHFRELARDLFVKGKVLLSHLLFRKCDGVIGRADAWFDIPSSLRKQMHNLLFRSQLGGATCYLKLGHPGRALEHLDELETLIERYTNLYGELLEERSIRVKYSILRGIVCEKLRRYLDAYSAYESVVEIDPQHQAALKAMKRISVSKKKELKKQKRLRLLQ